MAGQRSMLFAGLKLDLLVRNLALKSAATIFQGKYVFGRHIETLPHQ